jgi:hypothetical protein
MQTLEQALALSYAKARTIGRSAQSVSACVNAMLEASTAFAKSGAERSLVLATTMASARSPEAVAEIHAAFVRDSLRAASLMAARIADACAAAAKQCDALAREGLERASASSPSLMIARNELSGASPQSGQEA